MSKIILFFALISTSSAVFLQYTGWNEHNSGSIGPVWGIFFKPVEIDLTEVVTGHNVMSYPAGKNANSTRFIGINTCTQLTYIPKGIKHFWPNVIALAFHVCAFESITYESLHGFEKLQSLTFIKTPLHFLPANLFKLTPLLQDFFAQSNQIKIVEEHIFQLVPLLRYVDLSNNVCINDYALTREEIPALERELRRSCSSPPSLDTTTGGCKMFGCKVF